MKITDKNQLNALCPSALVAPSASIASDKQSIPDNVATVPTTTTENISWNLKFDYEPY